MGEDFGNGPRDCLGVPVVKPLSLGWAWRFKRQIGSVVWKAKIEEDGEGRLWGQNLKC